MAMMPEAKVKAQIKKFLVELGAWYCTPATGGFGRSGVPDFLVCWQGQFIGIEAKAPGSLRNTTTMQDRELVGIRAAGGAAIVCCDVAPLKALFDIIAPQSY